MQKIYTPTKMKKITNLLILFFIISFSSCQDNGELTKKMQQIKTIGDSDPKLALSMLDSIKTDADNASQHTRMTYDMLYLRLNDKANNIPPSDIMSRKVADYFESHGNNREKQEAYYYNGSVYRDLQDTPRALENFEKSIEIAEGNKDCDSLKLRNAYSNMQFLFYNVQDYKTELVYATKEYNLSKELKRNELLPIINMAKAYTYINDKTHSREKLQEAYTYIKNNKEQNVENLYILLYLFCANKEIDKANYLANKLNNNYKNIKKSTTDLDAMVEYYKLIGETDSAIAYNKRILLNEHDYTHIYDASEDLFKTYYKLGDIDNALKYANIFVNTTDTLDLGSRQEMAATVNNQYQYHLDKSKEEQTMLKAERYQKMLYLIAIFALIIISSIIIYNINKRNRQLRKIISMSKEIDSYKTKTEDINKQLQSVQEELNKKEKLLTDKIAQNQNFIRMLHKSELEEDASDVVEAIRQSANGKKEMSQSDWKQLFAAVDKLFPDFKEEIVKNLGNFTLQQEQVCYLIKIGLNNPQIQHLTNLPRVTVWRWVKKFGWASETIN